MHRQLREVFRFNSDEGPWGGVDTIRDALGAKSGSSRGTDSSGRKKSLHPAFRVVRPERF